MAPQASLFIPKSYNIVHETMVDFVERPIIEKVHLVQYDSLIPIIAVKLYYNGLTYSLPDPEYVPILSEEVIELKLFQAQNPSVGLQQSPFYNTTTNKVGYWNGDNNFWEFTNVLTSKVYKFGLIYYKPLNNKLERVGTPVGVRIRWNNKKDNTANYKEALGHSEDKTIIYFAVDRDMTEFFGSFTPTIEMYFEIGDNIQKIGSSPILVNVDRNPAQEAV